jgi:hypothetical protein
VPAATGVPSRTGLRVIDERARPGRVVRRGRLRCGMLVGPAKTASRLIREQK